MTTRPGQSGIKSLSVAAVVVAVITEAELLSSVVV
jgi:hypothetical protein